MSLKEDINYIKKEISVQESFIEKFFKIEQFYKKNKITIIATIVVVIVATAGYSLSNYLAYQNKIEANEAFNSLLVDSNNKEAQAILKEKNSKLYEIAMFMQDNSAPTDVKFLKELSLYSQAIKQQDIEKITSVTQSQEFLLKDFALFNKALIEAKNGDYAKSKETLSQIPETSNIIELAKMLQHFLLTK